jgi:hypothetical protein
MDKAVWVIDRCSNAALPAKGLVPSLPYIVTRNTLILSNELTMPASVIRYCHSSHV